MDIDSLSMELIKAWKGTAGSRGHSGVTNLPPKLRGKFQAWMKRYLSTKIKDLSPTQKTETFEAFKEIFAARLADKSPLAKNEMGLVTHKNGVVKMEFGSEVPEQVKKAAISWAKRRGLSPVDMKLAKNANSASSHVFSAGLATSPDQKLEEYRWTF